MSTVAVNEITDEVGTGSPAFTNGLAQSDIAGALNATGSAPIYACRAWVNFDGTTATIRDSGNVSSITKNGTGDYTVNFTTAMPDVNYSVAGTADADAGSGPLILARFPTIRNIKSISQIAIYSMTFGGNARDCPELSLSIFR